MLLIIGENDSDSSSPLHCSYEECKWCSVSLLSHIRLIELVWFVAYLGAGNVLVCTVQVELFELEMRAMMKGP